MVKQRFLIGFNGILLALFLDSCLLIFLRSVDSRGHFQTAGDKWQSFFLLGTLYGGFLLFELILYIFVRWQSRKKISKKKASLV